MPYEHLQFSRETPLTDRHKRQDRRPRFKPDDPQAFGRDMQHKMTTAQQRITTDEHHSEYDQRLLLKVILRKGEQVPQLNNITGVELVSQEDKEIVIAFLNEDGLAEVEQRLASLAKNGTATREQLLYAMEDFDQWSAKDRTGAALHQFGIPSTGIFSIDVELWPEERQDRRDKMFEVFEAELKKHDITILDTLKQPSLLMFRVRCDKDFVGEYLLRHRDVRTVDLPPRLGISTELLNTDIQQFPPVDTPDENAPNIAVLDSGITTNHPLLAPAIGDSQGYIKPNLDSNDSEPWHGTFVAGLTLYGDVERRIQDNKFMPTLRLFSGKVFEDDGTDQTEFVENSVDKAVRELHAEYQCRVFNLSYGDLNKIYDGRHLRGLGYTLDRLSRELNILFVVPTGNLIPNQIPDNPQEHDPQYLLDDQARILDPATAINALTIGGLVNKTATFETQRHPDTIENIVFSREGQPYPLTRSGPSVNGAVKPDLIETAGNIALMRTGGRTRTAGLGVLSLNGGFASGYPFSEDVGTSYAAPQAAHKAANILTQLPNGSANLLRTLMGAHANWPAASSQLLNPGNNSEGRTKLLRLCGYGQTDEESLTTSSDKIVTLYSEDKIAKDKCHFYEIPMPASFWSNGRRERRISVALAYAPAVRTTRLDYRMTKLWYTFVEAASLDEVETAFQRNREKGILERNTNRWISNQDRSKGSLQVSRWTFGRPLRNSSKLFVVVTRQDANWATTIDNLESYALSIVLDDRENNETVLYAQVQAELQARARARARV